MTEHVIDSDSHAQVAEKALDIKQDYRLNEAQSIFMAMGINPALIFAHYKERTYSYTKKGPGRAHKQGK